MRVGIVGKYTSLPDAYLSVIESLNHSGFFHGAKVDIELISAEDVEGLLGAGRLKDLDGIVIPGGFGERGIEGKIAAAGYAREEGIPCLGPLPRPAHHGHRVRPRRARPRRGQLQRVRRASPHPVIDLMDSQREVTDKGGTMRLGAYVAELVPGSQVARAYGKDVVSERHRHRYEFNPRYRTPVRGERAALLR